MTFYVNKSESGRSMVELLGMLAIMGIIGLAGVKMYHVAMAQHRANELINEAQKRAVAVAAQLMAGHEKNALSIAEFTDPMGYTFGVEANSANDKQFNITIAVVPADVCQKMKNIVGTGSTVRSISDFCDTLTFNDDLSATAYASDNATQQNCTATGFVWCTKATDNATAKCMAGSDCCTNATYDTQCQECNTTTGQITNKATSATCYFGSSSLLSHCDSGTCLDPGVGSNKKCLTNAECGGIGSGYFCKFDSYGSSTYCTEDAATAMGCASTATANCAKAGVCTPLGVIKHFSLQGLGPVIHSTVTMNWWSAKNWCEAQNKHLIPVEQFQCFKVNSTQTYVVSDGLNGPCCSEGKACNYWDADPCKKMWNGKNLTDERDANGQPYRLLFSPIVVDFAMKYEYGHQHYFWTSSNNGQSTLCNVSEINLTRGRIGVDPRHYATGSRALCR